MSGYIYKLHTLVISFVVKKKFFTEYNRTSVFFAAMTEKKNSPHHLGIFFVFVYQKAETYAKFHFIALLKNKRKEKRKKKKELSLYVCVLSDSGLLGFLFTGAVTTSSVFRWFPSHNRPAGCLNVVKNSSLHLC